MSPYELRFVFQCVFPPMIVLNAYPHCVFHRRWITKVRVFKSCLPLHINCVVSHVRVTAPQGVYECRKLNTEVRRVIWGQHKRCVAVVLYHHHTQTHGGSLLFFFSAGRLLRLLHMARCRISWMGATPLQIKHVSNTIPSGLRATMAHFKCDASDGQHQYQHSSTYIQQHGPTILWQTWRGLG